jgi:hypothetical protein
MAAGSFGLAAGWAIALLLQPPLPWLVAPLLLIGFCCGAMIPAFALTRLRVGLDLAGTALGLVNTSALLLGALLQTAVGIVLDLGWAGAVGPGGRVYEPGVWRLGFTTVLVVIGAGAGCAILLTRRYPGTRA